MARHFEKSMNTNETNQTDNYEELSNNKDVRHINYELFILVLTALSILNLVFMVLDRDDDVVQVALRVNVLLSLVFFIDFLLRLRAADSKRQYFLNHFGWLDLLGSLPVPGASLARIMRFVRTWRLLRRMGGRKVVRLVVARRADTALLFIILSVILILEFGSIAILKAESQARNANITTAEDAWWWVIVTISTVGYGDEYPVTAAGRFVANFVIFAGVAVFGTLSGYLANIFLGERNNANKADSISNEAILAEIKQLQQENAAVQQAQKQTQAQLQALNAELRKQLGKPDEKPEEDQKE